MKGGVELVVEDVEDEGGMGGPRSEAVLLLSYVSPSPWYHRVRKAHTQDWIKPKDRNGSGTRDPVEGLDGAQEGMFRSRQIGMVEVTVSRVMVTSAQEMRDTQLHLFGTKAPKSGLSFAPEGLLTEFSQGFARRPADGRCC